MKIFRFVLLISVAIPAPAQPSEREVVRRCSKEDCAMIVIRGETVAFKESDSSQPHYDIGRYDEAAQKWVPREEAPLRAVKTARGWRAVVSASLDAFDEYATIRLRIFDPAGELQQTYNGNYFFDDIEFGKLFGTAEEVLSIQTGGASSSIQDAVAWLLPPEGKPTKILDVAGVLRRFQPVGSGVSGIAGAWIDREVYDGVHPDTKGTRIEFWTWERTRRLLVNGQK